MMLKKEKKRRSYLKKIKINATYKQTNNKQTNKQTNKNLLIGQYKMCTHFQRKHLFQATNRHIVH